MYGFLRTTSLFAWIAISLLFPAKLSIFTVLKSSSFRSCCINICQCHVTCDHKLEMKTSWQWQDLFEIYNYFYEYCNFLLQISDERTLMILGCSQRAGSTQAEPPLEAKGSGYVLVLQEKL